MGDVASIQERLSRQELSEGTLKSFAEAVAALEAKGFKPTDVFPLGIIVQDGAGANFEVTPDQVGDLVKRIVDLKDLRPQLEIFPIGIVAPDRFRVETKIGQRSR